MGKCFFTGVPTLQMASLEEIALQDLDEPIQGPDDRTIYSEMVKTGAVLTCYIAVSLYESMVEFGDRILKSPTTEELASWQLIPVEPGQ